MSKRRFKVMMAQSPVGARELVRKITRDNDAPTRYYLLVDSYFGRYPQINIRRYGCDTYFAVRYGVYNKIVQAFCRTSIGGRIDVEFGSIRINNQAELDDLINESHEVTHEEYLREMNIKDDE